MPCWSNYWRVGNEPMPRPSILSPVLFVGAFSLIWAVIDRVAPAAGLAGEQIVWMRYGVHLIALTLICVWRGGFSFVKTRHPGLQFIRSLCMLGMPMLFLMAMPRMHPNTLLAILWIMPLALAVAGARETRAPLKNLVAVLIAFAGVTIILDPPAPSHGLHTLVFPAGAAFCFFAYALLTRLLSGEPEKVQLFYTAFWVFVALSFRAARFWQRPNTVALLIVVFIGVAGFGALWSIDMALKLSSPSTFAAAFYLQPVFVAAVEAIASHSHPSARVLTGMLLVCVGIAAEVRLAASSIASSVASGVGA